MYEPKSALGTAVSLKSKRPPETRNIPSWMDIESSVVAPGGGLVTAAVAALVSVSSLPASSVKDTRTLMALPSSAATGV